MFYQIVCLFPGLGHKWCCFRRRWHNSFELRKSIKEAGTIWMHPCHLLVWKVFLIYFHQIAGFLNFLHHLYLRLRSMLYFNMCLDSLEQRKELLPLGILPAHSKDAFWTHWFHINSILLKSADLLFLAIFVLALVQRRNCIFCLH